MSTSLFVLVLVHVAISLVGIATGFVWMAGLLHRRDSRAWTNAFLVATILTSATGFLFPIVKITPGIVFGVVSLLVLAVAVHARSVRHLEGRWHTAFIVTGLLAQYLNVFVLVVQSFQKIPVLHALAPTQSELPFAVTQLAVLVGFLVAGVLSVKRSHPVVLVTA
ncbi:hypothetical protein Pan44_23410 [Caulifigura coniformis]|uniref:DUF2306 domain-containing protein n=1 Tax=Caulifigura coniformis TaxID=2527983 RepID=A0A517SDV9_9PLAN|nr:hypothetical protein [Caulifigura coniformis]QDT54312.1 hypothetical protein Pan44_23410 [Caulifigura coniformis]